MVLVKNLKFLELLLFCKIEQEKVSGDVVNRKRFSASCKPFYVPVTPCNHL